MRSNRFNVRVGLSAVRHLAEGGAQIVMVCRNKGKADKIKKEIEEKYNSKVDIVVADFSSLADVRKAAQEILDKYPIIDVLINSAGMHSTKRVYNF